MAVLSNNIGLALTKVLLKGHYDRTTNLYNEVFSLAMWLVGLGYKSPKKSVPKGARGSQSMTMMMMPIFQEVEREIRAGEINEMELLCELLRESNLMAPPYCRESLAAGPPLML